MLSDNNYTNKGLSVAGEVESDQSSNPDATIYLSVRPESQHINLSEPRFCIGQDILPTFQHCG